jgi:SAM-dependent methyltransferase
VDESVRELFKTRYPEHWYFIARTQVLTGFVDRFVPRERRGVVADFGAGTGDVLAALSSGARAVAVEGDLDLAAAGTKRHDLRYVVASLADGVPIGDDALDMVLMLDVLEHLDDDRRVLRDARRALKPGGVLLVSVPALQSLWSSHDERHHHHRRYSRHQLQTALIESGFSCDRLTYFNTLLFPMAAASRILARLSATWAAGSDYDRTPVWVSRLLGGIFAQERHLVARWHLPIGVSLLALARRPGAGGTRPSDIR